MGRYVLQAVAGWVAAWMLTCMAQAGEREPGATPHPQYDLRVEIVPKDHALRVEGAIRNLANLSQPTLYLNQRFVIERLSVNGRPVEHEYARDEPAPPFVSVARPIHIKADGVQSVEFAYRGTLPERISDVNQIDASLVELALYAGWYPFNPSIRRFSSQVAAVLPKEFVPVSNGSLQHARERGGQVESVFHSDDGMDIVLVASPALQRFSVRRQRLAIELIAPGMEQPEADAILQRLSNGLQELTRSFGAPPGAGNVRFVISPRGGWGYSRSPLLVVSGQTRAKDLARPYGVAEDFHGNFHELAHFWWSVADPDGPDDWLNEGLAEYSAVLVAGHLFGPEYRAFVIKGFHDDLSRAKTQDSIVMTRPDSADSYINKYEKPVLMLDQLSARFGEHKVVMFLQRFYAQVRDARTASTQQLLDVAGRELGEEARQCMVRSLTAAGWTGEPGPGC